MHREALETDVICAATHYATWELWLSATTLYGRKKCRGVFAAVARLNGNERVCDYTMHINGCSMRPALVALSAISRFAITLGRHSMLPKTRV